MSLEVLLVRSVIQSTVLGLGLVSLSFYKQTKPKHSLESTTAVVQEYGNESEFRFKTINISKDTVIRVF